MAEIAPQLDILGYLRAATATGTALGAQISLNAYRMQELKSQEALRRLQEQQVAQKLQFDLEQHDRAVQYRADASKAMARVMVESQPELQVPAQGPEMEGGQQPTAFVPNPAFTPLPQSLLKNMLPVVTQHADNPEAAAAQLIANVGALEYHQAQALRQKALATAPAKPLSTIGKMQADREAALQAGNLSAAAEIDNAISKLHTTAASDVQKMVDEHKRQTGRDFSPEEIDDLYRIKMGLKAKAAVVQPVTFEKFANKNLQWYMENKTHFDAKSKKLRRPESTAEAMADMKAAYDSMQDHIAGMPQVGQQGGAPQQTTPVTEDTVIVVDSQGRKFKLPRRQLEDAKRKGYKEYEG